MTSALLEARVNSSTELASIDMELDEATILSHEAPLVMATPTILVVAVLFACPGYLMGYAMRGYEPWQD